MSVHPARRMCWSSSFGALSSDAPGCLEPLSASIPFFPVSIVIGIVGLITWLGTNVARVAKALSHQFGSVTEMISENKRALPESHTKSKPELGLPLPNCIPVSFNLIKLLLHLLLFSSTAYLCHGMDGHFILGKWLTEVFLIPGAGVRGGGGRWPMRVVWWGDRKMNEADTIQACLQSWGQWSHLHV